MGVEAIATWLEHDLRDCHGDAADACRRDSPEITLMDVPSFGLQLLVAFLITGVETGGWRAAQNDAGR